MAKSTAPGLPALPLPALEAAPSAWQERLRSRVAHIEATLPGDFGVYVRRLVDGSTLRWRSDEAWYLASTVKIPVAIAVLEKVEQSDLSLVDQLELRASDFVDGAGDLKWQEPGARFRVESLLGRSIEDSDSIATDMLIRLVGAEELNRRVTRWVGDGFGPLTTLLQVRYDVYGQLDPRVASLPSRTFVTMRAAGGAEARLTALAQSLGVARGALLTSDLESLFERYYETSTNSARLDAFGQLLERLVRGELLSQRHTALVLGHMQRIKTGKRRIEATLPAGVPFAQKTGTQIARACNVGVLFPQQESKQVVVAACAARYDHLSQAEEAFQELGTALGEVGLID